MKDNLPTLHFDYLNKTKARATRPKGALNGLTVTWSRGPLHVVLRAPQLSNMITVDKCQWIKFKRVKIPTLVTALHHNLLSLARVPFEC